MPTETTHPEGSQKTGDALCFCAGNAGAPFGAGVIHAYLISGRPAPQVVTGISVGALSAAAMWWTYRDSASGNTEGAGNRLRWARLRNYVSALTDEPYRVFWDALPEPSDFLVNRMPLPDPSVPGGDEGLERHQHDAERQRYHLVLLGQWLARLPIKIGRLAKAVEHIVLLREKKKSWWSWSRVKLWLSFLWMGLALAFWSCAYTVFRPMVPRVENQGWRFGLGPLLGWRIWSGAVFGFLAASLLYWLLALCAVWALVALLGQWVTQPGFFGSTSLAPWQVFLAHPRNALLGAVLCLFGGGFLGLVSYVLLCSPRTLESFLSGQGIQTGLLSDFHLRLALMHLFSDPDGKGKAARPEMKTRFELNQAPRPLIVAASLHAFRAKAQSVSPLSQAEEELRRVRLVWPQRGCVVEALRAALAWPVLFPPYRLKNKDWTNWHLPDGMRPQDGAQVLELVDGAVIRQNPLPALFEYLNENEEIVKELSPSRERPGIHVVYSVPTQERKGEGAAAVTDKQANIVDIAVTSLQLARRLDTELEVKQSNFISRLEAMIPGAEEKKRRTTAVFADEIAPARQLSFKNPLSPQPEEILQVASEGCRRTLERLYGNELSELAEKPQPAPREGGRVPCHELLERLSEATGRCPSSSKPGLPEICGQCDGLLVARERTAQHPAPQAPKAEPSEQEARRNEVCTSASVSTLTTASIAWKPRIVFVASGGVFRGSFHIGMAAALTGMKIKPDIIVGASVGTLIGSALAKMAYNNHLGNKKAVTALLGNLVDLFLQVDERVAKTRSLTSALRELSARLKPVELSPAKLRKLLKGSGKDMAHTIVGAPALLVQTLSKVFLIPPREMGKIASKLLAGRVTEAMSELGVQLKQSTLRRLGVFESLMGTSLLEQQVRQLLNGQEEACSVNLSTLQPFKDAGIQFYCTATNMGRQGLRILGDLMTRPDGLETPAAAGEQLAPLAYDFIEACLASSAFPAIFAPRRESDIFPGAGRRDVRFADGGIFDNLPFLHAVNVLANEQLRYRHALQLGSYEFLQHRHTSPHLFLAGALNVDPADQDYPQKDMPRLLDIWARARSLKDNVKVRGFESAAVRVDEQIARLTKAYNPSSEEGGEKFVDQIVSAALLPVFPADSEHLNKTFAFTAATGLKQERVLKSIANGCFQTHLQLAHAAMNAEQNPDELLSRSWKALRAEDRIPPIRHDDSTATSPPAEGECPYFWNDGQRVRCLFAQGRSEGKGGEGKDASGMARVWESCRKDRHHKAQHGSWKQGARSATAGSSPGDSTGGGPPGVL